MIEKQRSFAKFFDFTFIAVAIFFLASCIRTNGQYRDDMRALVPSPLLLTEMFESAHCEGKWVPGTVRKMFDDIPRHGIAMLGIQEETGKSLEAQGISAFQRLKEGRDNSKIKYTTWLETPVFETLPPWRGLECARDTIGDFDRIVLAMKQPGSYVTEIWPRRRLFVMPRERRVVYVYHVD